MNTHVNFSIAKLLKDKGFQPKSSVAEYWDIGGKQRLIEIWDVDYDIVHYEPVASDIMFLCDAPTIAEVVMWLYEKHGIWIYITQSTARLGFRCFIQRLNILGEVDIQNDEKYNTPTAAYEEAILHVLNNLI